MKVNGKKLKDALRVLGLTQEQAAIKMNTTRQTLSKWFNYEVLPEEVLQNVSTNLDIDLRTTSAFGGPVSRDANQPSPHEPSISKDQVGVPYYDIDFTGGFDLVYESDRVHPSFYIDFLPFNDSDCWINVTGKSMGPLIAHGDIVALKEVKDWKSFLLEGEIYAIVTNNGFRTIKMLGQGKDDEHYTLIPYNKSEDYKPQPIPKNVITHIFRVKGAIKKFF